jgi:hypothetical protein
MTFGLVTYFERGETKVIIINNVRRIYVHFITEAGRDKRLKRLYGEH